MPENDLASIFEEAINKTPAEQQQLLESLSSDDRVALDELLAADKIADEQHLFKSLNYGIEERVFRGKQPKQIHDYQILELIGEGGMGQVYKAHHSRLKRDVAIKIMSRPDRASRKEDVDRFDREIAAIGGLRHRNIVQATDAGVDGDINYLVMEFVDGPDVSRALKANGKLSLPDACEIIRQAALGLSHAHAHGLIHRDVKPSNLMIATDGSVKLADMGLALLRDWDSQVSKVGQIMGTIDYIAPEQIDNAQNVDQRSDLYSLGCMFYELLAGDPPFAAPEFESTLQKLNGHGQKAPPSLSEACPDVPDEVVAIVSRLMAKDPAQRFQSAAELAKAIAPFAKAAQIRSLVHKTLGTPASMLDTDRIGSRDIMTFRGTQALPVSTETKKAKSNFSFKLVAVGLTLAAALALALNTPQIIRIVTNKGVLVIENSEDVEVSITQGGDKPVIVFDKVNQREYTLDVGDNYQLLIKEPKTGIELSSETFSIKRNAKTILNARVESLEPTGLSNLELENLSQSQLFNWLLEHGAREIKGYDKHANYVSLRGSQRAPEGLELPVSKLELWIDADRFTQLDLDEFLRVASFLPVEGLLYFGDKPSASTLRTIAQQKNIIHVRFYRGFNFRELKKLPEGSFAHAKVLMLHGQLPAGNIELLASHFPNINKLNIESFDYDQTETLKQFPLEELTIQLGGFQATPNLKTHNEIKTLSVVYDSNLSMEPEFDCKNLPPNIDELNLQNVSLTAEHFKQLSVYENLSSISVVFTDTCIRPPLEMSDAIAQFKKLRQDVYVTLASPSKESRVWNAVARDTGMDWLAEHANELQVETPVSVISSTDTKIMPDLYTAKTLIDGSGLSGPIETIEQIGQVKHGYTIERSGWVTAAYTPDYFDRRNFTLPKFTFTLNAPVNLEGMVYWGYVHARGSDGSRNEPKTFRFAFFDKDGKQVGENVSRSVSRPIQHSARAIPFPAVDGVLTIEIEFLDNFFDEIKMLSGGDRVGLGEIRFLSSKK